MLNRPHTKCSFDVAKGGKVNSEYVWDGSDRGDVFYVS